MKTIKELIEDLKCFPEDSLVYAEYEEIEIYQDTGKHLKPLGYISTRKGEDTCTY